MTSAVPIEINQFQQLPNSVVVPFNGDNVASGADGGIRVLDIGYGRPANGSKNSVNVGDEAVVSIAPLLFDGEQPIVIIGDNQMSRDALNQRQHVHIEPVTLSLTVPIAEAQKVINGEEATATSVQSSDTMGISRTDHASEAIHSIDILVGTTPEIAAGTTTEIAAGIGTGTTTRPATGSTSEIAFESSTGIATEPSIGRTSGIATGTPIISSDIPITGIANANIDSVETASKPSTNFENLNASVSITIKNATNEINHLTSSSNIVSGVVAAPATNFTPIISITINNEIPQMPNTQYVIPSVPQTSHFLSTFPTATTFIRASTADQSFVPSPSVTLPSIHLLLGTSIIPREIIATTNTEQTQSIFIPVRHEPHLNNVIFGAMGDLRYVLKDGTYQFMSTDGVPVYFYRI